MPKEPITTDSPTPEPEPSTAEPRDRKRRSYVRHGYHALKRRVKVAGSDAIALLFLTGASPNVLRLHSWADFLGVRDPVGAPADLVVCDAPAATVPVSPA